MDDVPGLRSDDAAEREEAFLTMVDAAVKAIPSPFAERLGSVAIVVEDEPTAAQLASVGARGMFGLFGLYQGVPRTAYGAEHAALASKITIFRGPLERRHGGGDGLAQAIEDTVIHEVAHHFGISDQRIRELQRAARSI